MKEGLIHYLQQQIRTTPERLTRFTHDISGKEHPQRFMFAKLSKYIKEFINKQSNNKMIIVPGFRGVGKTTLMAQLCSIYKNQVNNLFISIEDMRNLFDAGIVELMSAYEEIIGNNLENIKEPLLIFLDEIQSDPKWAVTLKSLFEKTSRIFFCCTGSSAITLQTTTNLARRAIFEKMPPICFTEYEMIKNGIYPTKGLKNEIFQTIYYSNNANESFQNLLKLKSRVDTYWTNINRMDVKSFLTYGTLPFALTMPNETTIYDSISLLLDKIIKQDLPTLGNFATGTLNSVKRILFSIAENDTTSLTKLESIFRINRLTIADIFEALEKAELIIKVPAYGSNMSAAKKANKYLFMSPAIRMTFLHFTGVDSTYLVRQGKLLEDLFGAHLYREFILNSKGDVRYDSEQGGADFILQILNHKQIIIEVGIGKKDKKQIVNSMKKINPSYSLVFSSTKLNFDEKLKIVFVPLDYLFLM